MSKIKYMWDAYNYEKHSTPQTEWGNELIEKLCLQGHERLLDIGCGDGKLTAKIAAMLPKGSVVGMDSSDSMIEIATTRYPNKDFQNLTFIQNDATNLLFEDDFDIVFSNAVLHWIPDHVRVLKGIKHSLHPNGKTLLQMGGLGNASELLDIAYKMIREPTWGPYFNAFKEPYYFFGPEEYKKWLKQAGFETIRVELVHKDMVHESPDALIHWLSPVSIPFTKRLPELLRILFLEEMVEKYIDHHPTDKDGKTHVGMVRLEVEAQKPIGLY